MTLTTIKLISPYLTKDNQEMIFKETHRKPTREVEKVLANLFPQEEEILDSIRKLPSPAAKKTAQNLTRCATSTLVNFKAKGIVKPIAPQRVKVEFSASNQFRSEKTFGKKYLKSLGSCQKRAIMKGVDDFIFSTI